MPNADGYEVLVEGLTLHQAVTPLTNSDGDVIGHQNGNGRIFRKGEVVDANWLSPDYVNALDDENHPSHEAVSKRLKAVSKTPEEGLSEPFPGYDDMDEAEVLAVLPNLPSAAISQIKAYEVENEGRESIAHYSAGFGESPAARINRDPESLADEPNDEKVVRRMQTREVTDDDVVPGEGITGTGDPRVEPGTAQAEKEGSSRRGRRSRGSSKKQKGGSKSEGGSGDEGTPSAE